MLYRILVGLLFIFIYSANANTPVEFYNDNWTIACDNTLTCRMVGNGQDVKDKNNQIAILLERKAGADQPITDGYFRYSSREDDKKEQELKLHPISLVINNQSLSALTKKN